MVDRDILERLAGGQAHVVEGVLDAEALAFVGIVRRVGHAADDRQRLPRIGAPGDVGRDLRRQDLHRLVEHRVGVGAQRPPGRQRFRPKLARGRVLPPLEIGEGGLVGRDHPGARAALDRHVAQRHPLFHREAAHRRALVFDDVPGTARDADGAEDREDQILRRRAGRQLAGDQHLHRLGALLHDGLRGEHVLDLGNPDAEGERAERAVGRGVAVAAHHQRAGEDEPQLRPDDVHHALPPVAHRINVDALLGAVFLDVGDHPPRVVVLVGDAVRARRGRHHVVRDADGEIGPINLAPRRPEAGKRIGRHALVDEMAVDEQDRAIVAQGLDHVSVPDLFVESLAHPLRSSLRHPSILREPPQRVKTHLAMPPSRSTRRRNPSEKADPATGEEDGEPEQQRGSGVGAHPRADRTARERDAVARRGVLEADVEERAGEQPELP